MLPAFVVVVINPPLKRGPWAFSTLDDPYESNLYFVAVAVSESTLLGLACGKGAANDGQVLELGAEN